MASTAHRFLFGFAIFVAILSICSAGRPCKTLLISSYSFSFSNPSNPNPNSNNPTGYVTIFTEIRQFHPRRPHFLFDRPLFPIDLVDEPQQQQQQPPQRSVFGYGGYDFSSLRDRTKDILSVVVALLFGVGCGALTAVTMYLVWTLFASRYDFHRNSSYEEFSDGDDHDHDEEDVFSPKKMGYEKIPAKEAAAA